ncbi:unnamed protein product [Protopolystoma xenopodis]|uniref:Uncharacterized protein n=1 Tax=Protopolystoma xenopodis TaxID=117903 RepID=A0A3S5CL29_9PLAT|nr:unnamed protein product [Protopolystoma xenopodis]
MIDERIRALMRTELAKAVSAEAGLVCAMLQSKLCHSATQPGSQPIASDSIEVSFPGEAQALPKGMSTSLYDFSSPSSDARMQMRNIRSEKPLELKGVEHQSLASTDFNALNANHFMPNRIALNNPPISFSLVYSPLFADLLPPVDDHKATSCWLSTVPSSMIPSSNPPDGIPIVMTVAPTVVSDTTAFCHSSACMGPTHVKLIGSPRCQHAHTVGSVAI